MKRISVVAMLSLVVLACGPDRAMIQEEKFDAGLRQKIASVGEQTPPETLAVLGKCTGEIDAAMQGELTAAGARIQTVQGEIFAAFVTSENVFDVAALPFVVQLQLSRESRLLSR